MQQYLELLKKIVTEGEIQYDSRTGQHVIGTGYHTVFRLEKGLPLLTTKWVGHRLVFEELFWKLRGERNIKSLFERDVHIWDENAFQHYLEKYNLTSKFPKNSSEWQEEFQSYKDKIAKQPGFAEAEGDLGPVYGYQMRRWPKGNGEEVDQLKNILRGIKEKPGSRYHVMSVWNVAEIENMVIGPCPFWQQFSVYGDNIDLHSIQRSGDTFLGVPFNYGQEAALLGMVAKETGLKPRKLSHTCINAHVFLGVSPRDNFWTKKENVNKFQNQAREIKNPAEYLDLKQWYIRQVPEEEKENERKDHMPFVLEQLSKEPKPLPSIKLADIPLLEAIEKPVEEVITLEGYNYHKWDSKARMAA